MGGPPLQNVSPAQPSGLNPRPTSHGIYNHAIGGPSFQHNPLTIPPSMVLGSPDAINLSAVEVYRQKHEVTATVRILSPYNNCHVTYLKKPCHVWIYCLCFTPSIVYHFLLMDFF